MQDNSIDQSTNLPIDQLKCGMQDAKNSIEYQVSSEERKRKEMQEKQFSVFS